MAMFQTAPAILLVLLLIVPPVAAQDTAGFGGVLVRVDGDVAIGPNETVSTLVVVGDGSHTTVAGTTDVVVIVGGHLDLTGTVRRQLVLVNATATLYNGSVIEGDVSKNDATIQAMPGSRIDGNVEEGGYADMGLIFALLFGAIFLVGVPLALVLAGAVSAWLFPRQLRALEGPLAQRIGGNILTAAILWLALPVLALLLLLTVIGLPTGIGILVFFFPFIWLVGYIASGTCLGDYVLTRGGKRDRPHHPSLAASVGILIFIVVGFIPFVGGLVAFLAGAYGSGAAVLAAVTSAQAYRRGGTPPGAPSSATPSSGGP